MDLGALGRPPQHHPQGRRRRASWTVSDGVVGLHGAGADDDRVAFGRSVWVSARASGPVIHWLVPSGAVVRPSAEAASLSTTQGRPVVRCFT